MSVVRLRAGGQVREEEEEELVTSLNQTKQELLCEIKNYEDNMRHIKTGQMKQVPRCC